MREGHEEVEMDRFSPVQVQSRCRKFEVLHLSKFFKLLTCCYCVANVLLTILHWSKFDNLESAWYV